MIASIIIPNWNGMKFIKVCLDSVLASDAADFEVIVVDNGSTDGSREYIERTYSSVRVVSLPKNLGFARACNEGIRAARGEFIVLLNNDIEVERMWLRELVEGMRRHPECAMGTSKMVQYENRRQLYNTGDTFTVACSGGGRGFSACDEGQYEREEHVFGACAGAGIYRRTLFERIGTFDEDFFIFSEDVDVNLRAQLAGERCVYLPRAIVYHWGTATVGFNSDRHVFLFARNNLFVLIKNYTLSEFVRHSGALLREIAQKSVTYSLSGQGWPVFKSRCSFLRLVPRMLCKRIALVAQRRRSLADIPEIMR